MIYLVYDINYPWLIKDVYHAIMSLLRQLGILVITTLWYIKINL